MKEFRNEPGIYKITNLINWKCYIGQSVKLLNRISEHRRATSDQIISKAIVKYGLENFKFEVLAYCEKEELDSLEIKYISEYDCTVPNGYNISIGDRKSVV